MAWKQRSQQQFDVFLCHNSEDKPAVIEIAQQLQQNGLKPWLDETLHPPGALALPGHPLPRLCL